MIRSMTGFGEAQLEDNGHVYHLEIRSVNNRYLKASVHLPESFAFLETDAERLLRERLSRGSISVRLHIRDLTASAAQEINAAAIRAYVAQLHTASGDDPRAMIDLATLATLPGVCQPRELTEAQREHHWEITRTLSSQALDHLIEMRCTEGRALAADLHTHCRRIEEHVDAVRARAPAVIEEYRNRLASRVRELLTGSNAQLAEADLLKEVSIYAERSDISEELSRLASHVAQFEAVAADPEPAGRKMEFIAQEMLREANTMGSKSGDPELARHIIEIKSAIDRIKEQVQNVE